MANKSGHPFIFFLMYDITNYINQMYSLMYYYK